MSQPPKTATFFPDTNFLLECVDPAECPWAYLTDAELIRLVVVLKVRSEVDSLKNAGRGRRSDRARNWVSRFRGMRQSGNVAVLRDNSPRVEVISAPVLVDVTDLHELLQGAGDREVLRQIATVNARRADLEGQFLTDDGGAYDLAQAAGLAAAEVPLDLDGAARRWRLPPENDTKDKRLIEMQKKLEGLEARAPKLTVLLEVAGTTGGRFDFTAKRYPPLTQDQAEQVLSLITRQRPAKSEFSTTRHATGLTGSAMGLGLTAWQAPSAEDVSKYIEHDRPEWERYCRQFLGSIHLLLEAPHRFVLADLSISNGGTVPASGMSALIETLGGALFCTDSSDDISRADDFAILIKDAPAAPQGRHLGGMFPTLDRARAWAVPHEVEPLLSFRNFSGLPFQVDELHWRDRSDDLVSAAELICGEFRHRHDPENVRLRLFLDGKAGKLQSGAIRVRLSANNLPEPSSITFPYRVKWEEADTMQAAYDLFSGRHFPVGEIPKEALKLLQRLSG